VVLVPFVVVALSASCQRAGDDALLIGRLFGDPSAGCVWIGSPKHGVEVDWPPLYDVDVERTRISGPQFLAEEGDWFRMGGGIRPDLPVTPGCSGTEGQQGLWATNGVDYFGDERPSNDLGTT
jgi:hypothetical protein